MANDSPNGKACVVLREVTKDYNGFRALDRVSFEIKEGEIFGVHWPEWRWKNHYPKDSGGVNQRFSGRVHLGDFLRCRSRSLRHTSCWVIFPKTWLSKSGEPFTMHSKRLGNFQD